MQYFSVEDSIDRTGRTPKLRRLVYPIAWRSTVPDATKGDWRVETFRVNPAQELGQAVHVMLDPVTTGGRGVPTGLYKRLIHGDQVVMSDTQDEFLDHTPLFRLGKGDVLVNGLGLGCAVSVLLWMQQHGVKADAHDFSRNHWGNASTMAPTIGRMMPSGEIREIIVVEQSKDVIELVLPEILRRFGFRLCARDPISPVYVAKSISGVGSTGPHRLVVIHGNAYDAPEIQQTIIKVLGIAVVASVWHDIWPTISDLNIPQMDALARSYQKMTMWWQGFWCQPECHAMRLMQEGRAAAGHELRARARRNRLDHLGSFHEAIRVAGLRSSFDRELDSPHHMTTASSKPPQQLAITSGDVKMRKHREQKERGGKRERTSNDDAVDPRPHRAKWQLGKGKTKGRTR